MHVIKKLNPFWLGLEQVFEIRRCWQSKGEWHEAVRYGVTNLPAIIAIPERLLTLKGRIIRTTESLRYEPDHVIAEKHGGPTSLENLAWSCLYCNRFKGTDLASVDPASKKVVFLFHPREQK